VRELGLGVHPRDMIHGHALECPNLLQKDEARMHVYLAYAHLSKQLGSNPLLNNIKKSKNEVKMQILSGISQNFF
jgi:hypothetical protein